MNTKIREVLTYTVYRMLVFTLALLFTLFTFIIFGWDSNNEFEFVVISLLSVILFESSWRKSS